MEKHKPLWTSYFIAKSLNLELKFSKNNTFSSLNTNSRLTKPNSLFIAIKGEKFDGHDFITQAIANGASGILCSQDYMNIHQTSIQAQLFPVQNTLMAFRLLAKTWRKQFSIPIIAIGGSVGKTTTKELVASMLHGKYKNILKTQGSQNGFIGIPMTLVELNSSHEIAIIEIGIDEIGAMKNHLETVAPTHGLITTIGPEHIERLLNIKTVAQEECLLLKEIFNRGGQIAVNQDDQWILKTLKPVFKKNISSKNIIYFSFNKKNHSTLTGKYFFNKNKIKISAPNKKQFTFNLPLMGTHNAHNFLGAFALLRFFDLSQKQIKLGLKTFLPPEGRSQITKLNRNIVILDYYNANPDSMKAALELLSNTTKKESFACLGDMLELGSKELIYHQNLSTWIKKFKINNIFLYGKLMKALLQKLKQIKYKGMYEHFSSQEALTNKLLSTIRADSIILIKGSHGMKMENIWYEIKRRLKNK